MARVVVVSAGLSQPSATRLLADRLTDAVTDRLRVADLDPEVTVLELRELGTDIMGAMLSGGMSSPRLARASATLAAADAVIAVTPVFTASYSGLFKSFFDVLDPGVLRGTPVLVAATAGTPRHSLVLDHALRPMFTYLQAVVVPTGVFAATADFGGPDGSEDGLPGRIARAADELTALLTRARDPQEGARSRPAGIPTRWPRRRPPRTPARSPLSRTCSGDPPEPRGWDTRSRHDDDHPDDAPDD